MQYPTQDWAGYLPGGEQRLPHLGDPRRTRTCNQGIKSPLLFQIELAGQARQLYREEIVCQDVSFLLSLRACKPTRKTLH
jgi:hypothetical protein